LQSASRRKGLQLSTNRAPAECNSEIQQITNLRYGFCASTSHNPVALLIVNGVLLAIPTMMVEKR
jgi:hypothetical protein